MSFRHRTTALLACLLALALFAVSGSFAARNGKVPTPEDLKLDGKVQGTYTYHPGPVDMGMEYSLSGPGEVRPLGDVTMNASFRTLGYIRQGQVRGDLTLVSAQGTLNLELLGPKQKGGAPPPIRFAYTITSGTNIYANLHGTGAIRLTLKKGADEGNGDFEAQLSK